MRFSRYSTLPYAVRLQESPQMGRRYWVGRSSTPGSFSSERKLPLRSSQMLSFLPVALDCRHITT